ncbi:serine/arginine-rich splicing factor 4-like [Battus philenor]|uniref:serine/arginine-rich splicing factor 4-like n=1 Tax=Battus philenor TaxID=42288 RepID=UPI0035D048DC
MANYGYPYGPQFSQMIPPNPEYANQGDGYREYYEMGKLKEERETKRSGREKNRTRTRSRSQSGSGSSSKSRSHSRSRSRSRSHSRTPSVASRVRNLTLKEPGLLDAFRILYLTPSKHKKSTTKFLATKKRQDQIKEILKRDRFGSKRWFFYPRPQSQSETTAMPATRENSDQRFKVDGDFFRKYKRSKKVNSDAPIMKLKRWELIFYKKLGFIQAV